MCRVDLTSKKHKGLTFSPNRIGELDILPESITVPLLYNNQVTQFTIEQSLAYNEENESVELLMSFITDTDEKSDTSSIDPSVFGYMLLESYNEDLDIENIESFMEVYKASYNRVSSDFIHQDILLDNTTIKCFGFVKLGEDIVATVDNALFSLVPGANSDYRRSLEVSALTTFHDFSGEASYTIELYAGDTRITLNNARHIKFTKGGLIRECSMTIEGSINYDKITYDSFPQYSITDTENKETIKLFIDEREEYLNFSRQDVLKGMELSLFKL